MLYYRSAEYEASSRTLTVRYRSPSGGSWALYEYRDVAPDVYRRVLAAAPDSQRVIDREVAPWHDVRRRGEHSWRPRREDPDELRSHDEVHALTRSDLEQHPLS